MVIEKVFRSKTTHGVWYAEKLSGTSKWKIREGGRFGEVVAVSQTDEELNETIEHLKQEFEEKHRDS